MEQNVRASEILNEDEKLLGPHQDQELELMLANKKPAALISHQLIGPFMPYVREGRFVSRKIYILGPPGRRFLDYGFAQPGEGWRLERIQDIYNEVTETGLMTGDHHRELGELLGYSQKAIDHFVNKITNEAISEELRWAIGPNAYKAYGAIKNDLKSPDYALVWVDIRDLFANTGSQQRLDVNHPTGGENSIGDRVERAKVFWANGGYMNPSLIGYNDHFKKFDFSDGRHRLVAAYQLGERWAPVLVDRDSLPKLKELVKTK